MYKQKGPIADLEYPFCREDGFFAKKQCYGFLERHCVDRMGDSVPGKGKKNTPGIDEDEFCEDDLEGRWG